MSSVIELAVDAINVSNRYRKDHGDIGGLAASIEQLGLLQPIGVTASHDLVFGHRRLLAFHKLGRATIPARVIDVPAIVLAEHAENEIRKDFTVSERVAIGQAVEAELGKRQGQRTDLASDGQESLLELRQNFDEVEPGKRTDQIAADKAGFGNKETYRQAKAVVEKAAPELVDAVDRGTVAVSTAAKLATAPVAVQQQAAADPKKAVELAKAASAAKVKEIRQTAKEETQAITAGKKAAVIDRLETIAAREVEKPTGLYDVLVIDPPWPMQKIERDVRPNQTGFDYPTMSEEELAHLELPADKDCHVWVWTTHKFLPMALRLIETWGLKYVCTFVWHKPGGFQPIGLPQYNAEFAVYARKGTPTFVDTTAFNTCFNAPRGAHSEKPQEFYDMVFRVTAGRRLDMFNRRQIEGFSSWGNEAIHHG